MVANTDRLFPPDLPPFVFFLQPALQWLQKLRMLGIPIKGPDPQVSYEISDVLQVPFKYGSIQLAREMETPFDEEALKIIQSFAQLLAFGYARYLDLIKLEEQNKERQIGWE